MVDGTILVTSLWERGMPHLYSVHMQTCYHSLASARKKRKIVPPVPVHEVLKVIINSL